MKLIEFKNFIDGMVETGHGDWEVVVSLNQTSIGIEAFTKVKSIHPGFDWEYGQIRINTEDEIVKEVKEEKKNITKKQSCCKVRRKCCSYEDFPIEIKNNCKTCGKNI